jgi:hypothetical protein
MTGLLSSIGCNWDILCRTLYIKTLVSISGTTVYSTSTGGSKTVKSNAYFGPSHSALSACFAGLAAIYHRGPLFVQAESTKRRVKNPIAVGLTYYRDSNQLKRFQPQRMLRSEHHKYRQSIKSGTERWVISNHDVSVMRLHILFAVILRHATPFLASSSQP